MDHHSKTKKLKITFLILLTITCYLFSVNCYLPTKPVFAVGVGQQISSEVFCGNGACDVGENSSNCPADCGGGGPPPPPPPPPPVEPPTPPEPPVEPPTPPEPPVEPPTPPEPPVEPPTPPEPPIPPTPPEPPIPPTPPEPPVEPPVVPPIIESIWQGIGDGVQQVGQAIKENIQQIQLATRAVEKQVRKQVEKIRGNPEIQQVMADPVVNVVTKVVAVGTVAVAATTGLISLIPLAASVSDFAVLPIRLLSAISLAGMMRRRRQWGTVYDAETKQPLDPVYVVLKDKNNKEIQTRITDMNGRFGFFAPPGEYYIEAKKTHYQFPSQKILGTFDEIYDNIYRGGLMKIIDPKITTINIPMDALGFDWNEMAKKKYIKFNYRWEIVKRWLPEILFFLGFILSLVVWLLKPTIFNQIMVWVFIGLWLLKRFGFKQRVWGLVLDKKTKKPLPFAFLRIFFAKLNQQIHFAITDAMGRYYVLVQPGKYDVSLEKKTEKGFEIISKISGIKAKKGVLNQDLFVSPIVSSIDPIKPIDKQVK